MLKDSKLLLPRTMNFLHLSFCPEEINMTIKTTTSNDYLPDAMITLSVTILR